MSTIRIALLGERKVGKSSFLTLLNTGDMTNVKDYDRFYYKVEENPITVFRIVETEKADVIFLMFDLTNNLSLNYVEKCLHNCSKKPVIILGNKSDLINYDTLDAYREHPIYSKIEKFMKKYNNIIGFHNISVKEFNKITKALDNAIFIFSKD